MLEAVKKFFVGWSMLPPSHYTPRQIEQWINSPQMKEGVEALRQELTYPTLPWRPIAELADKYETELLLLAPELVDLDCNPAGVGMGFWQDDGLLWHMTQEQCDARDPNKDYGCFLAGKWDMHDDEWHTTPCTPTHYLKLRGAT